MSDSRPPEFEPPMACVSRVMKAALPDNILLTKDARSAFVRASGIFIFYLTHCANDFCKENKRQTIFPQDVMAALRELGFDDFEKPLEEFLEAYKKEAEQKKPSVTKPKKVIDNTKSGQADEEDLDGEEDDEDDSNDVAVNDDSMAQDEE